MEKLLPTTQKREWIKLAEEYRTSKQLFKLILDFLLKKKRVLDYMNSDARTISSARICHSITGQVGEEINVVNSIQNLAEKHSELQQCVEN